MFRYYIKLDTGKIVLQSTIDKPVPRKKVKDSPNTRTMRTKRLTSCADTEGRCLTKGIGCWAEIEASSFCCGAINTRSPTVHSTRGGGFERTVTLSRPWSPIFRPKMVS